MGFEIIKLLTLICFITFNAFATIEFREDTHATQESSAECALSIAKSHFQKSSIIAIVTSGLQNVTNKNIVKTTYNMIVDRIMEEMRWSIMVKMGITYNGKNKFTSLEKVHNYILFMKSESECTMILDMLVKTSSWNPHALFHIYIDGLVIEWEAFATYVLAQFWKYFVINVSISVPQTIFNTRLNKIVTWMPFKAGNCGKQFSQFIEVGRCQNSEILPSNADIFPEKVPMDLNNCPVRIVTTTWPPFIISPDKKRVDALPIINDVDSVDLENGIEIKTLRTIAEKRNFQTKFYLDDQGKWGRLHNADNSTGMMGALIRSEMHIGIGTITPRERIHRKFDFTAQYFQDEITWVVSTADTLPHWIGLIHIFQPFVWLACLIFYGFICVMMWMIASYRIDELPMYTKVGDIILVTFRIMIGNVPNILPKSTLIRRIILLWSIFGFNFVSAYTSSLISMITSPLRSERINTVEDILKFNLTIGMTAQTIEYFRMEQYSSDKIASEILQRYILCEEAAGCLDRVAQNSKFATAVSRKYYEYVKHNYIDHDGEPKIRAFSTNIVSPPIEMIMLKGYPLLKKIDLLLLQIIGAGLIDFWAKGLSDEKNAASVRKMLIRRREHQPLDINHLEGAFYILGIGMIISSFAFLIEFFYFMNLTKKT